MSKIFLTGITGLVGSAFVTALLRERKDIDIVCLTRKGGASTVKDRVESIIRDQCAFDNVPNVADDILKNITVIEGDVATFDAATLAANPLLKGVDTIFHCAADVNLGKDPDGRVFKINYGGTVNMVALAKLLNVKAFHYVSTAYTAGRLVGRAMEDTPVNVGFYNPYEESKFQAENYVRQCGIPFTIYRPSIIVGRRSDGRIRKPLAFYRILEFIGKLKAHFCCKNKIDFSVMTDLRIHFETQSSEKIYFVPIDYVQFAVTKLFQTPVCGKTFHVTGDSPVTTQQIDETVSKTLRVKKLFYEVGTNIPLTSQKDEKLAERLLGDLYPYFSTNITFDQTNVRTALGDEALNWDFARDDLETMVRSFYIDFFPNVPWLQDLMRHS